MANQIAFVRCLALALFAVAAAGAAAEPKQQNLFQRLPLATAIKVVNGNGQHQIATVEDPQCGYCRKLTAELSKIANVTVYTFVIPILGERSQQMATKVWCSSDPAKAWREWMLDRKIPSAAEACSLATSRIAEHLRVADALRVQGTPRLIFANGSQVSGAVSAAKIEQFFAQVESGR